MSWTISRYFVVEVARYTAFGLLAALPVVLIPNFFDRADEFLVGGLSLADSLEIARYVVPLVLGYTLPIAFPCGLMLAIGRLGGDCEITAMRASGLSAAALIAPALLLGAIVSALTAYLMIEQEPRCKRELLALSLRLASSGNLIQAQHFQSFGPRMIFVQARGPDRRLEGVMISDASNPDRRIQIFAEAGVFSFDPESGRLRLSLENGDLRLEPNPSDAFDEYRISFARIDYEFPALALGAGPYRYRVDELALPQLREAIRRIEAGDAGPDLAYQNPRVYAAQIQRMLAIPLAPLLFALVGAPLAVRGVVRSRARGVWLALGVFAGYYALFSYGQDIAREGALPAEIAIWIPNAILLAAGIALVCDTRRLR